jgi:hypothetical protein
MNIDRMSSLVSRVFFVTAFALLVLAVLERVLGLFGYTILGGSYTPGRVLEFAGILVLFAIALLARQIREVLRGGSGRT